MGGQTGVPAQSAVIEDLDFSAETSVVISATLDTARSRGTCVSGILKGYYMGGYTGSPVATIDDFLFAVESSSVIWATLDTAKYIGVGVQGYIG